MIECTKINGEIFFINPHLIEQIEENPETRIYSVSGKVFLVKEKRVEILERIIEYRKKLGINRQEN